MVKEVIYYDIICDRCGKSFIDESETCYPDKDSAEMFAEQSEWVEINGKDYCPDGYELDEETDEYVPKKGGEKWVYIAVSARNSCTKIPMALVSAARPTRNVAAATSVT